ncbi:MAG: hypothetical protein JRI68_03840 [Deltaproteobacteria bacterium]|nr:hypothetical protein [Deltaproteobacteria bacterium]
MAFGGLLLRNAAARLRGRAHQIAGSLGYSPIGSAWGHGSIPWQVPLSQTLTDHLQRALDPGHRAELVFDLAGMETRMSRLARTGGRQGCRFLQPVKALAAGAFFDLAKTQLDGFDVSNTAEYEALPDDLSGCHVSVTSPSFVPARRADLTRKGNSLTIYVGSEEQYFRLEALDLPVAYGVRLESVSLLDRGQRRRTGLQRRSRFGISASDRPLLERLTSSRKHQFVGFHVHHGFGLNEVGTYEQLASSCGCLAESLGIALPSLNLGGGLHAVLPDQLAATVAAIRRALPTDTELLLEPGDYLSIGCAAAIGSVESVVRRPRWPVVALNLSAACHLRWSYPFPIDPTGTRARGSGEATALLVGPTCCENDIIGRFRLRHPRSKAPLQVGDTVLFGGISGYSLAWNLAFNGIAPAHITLLPRA